jgi:hypothetical protein
MKLYQGNAKELVGKKIDCKIRRFGCYPMEVKEMNGELYVIDANGVCMPIPEKETDFNCQYFDFVVDE